jgi:uncharacterized protein DUF3592
MPTSNKPPGWMLVGFLLLGLLLTGLFGHVMVWRPLRIQLFYVETTCIVLEKKLESVDSLNLDAGATERPLIHIEYQAVGRTRQTWTYDASGISDKLHNSNMVILARFTKGQRYPCWYDPDNPDSAVLTRSFSWWTVMVMIPLTFMVIGAKCLIYNRRFRETTQGTSVDLSQGPELTRPPEPKENPCDD